MASVGPQKLDAAEIEGTDDSSSQKRIVEFLSPDFDSLDLRSSGSYEEMRQWQFERRDPAEPRLSVFADVEADR